MVNYLKVIRVIKKLDIEKKRKNNIIRDAVLAELCNLPIELLKLPFMLILGFCNIMLGIFEIIADGLNLIMSLICNPTMKIIDLIERIPKFYFGDKQEHQEIIKMIKENNVKKVM